MDLPKESATWGLAYINETEVPADLTTKKNTGSRGGNRRPGLFLDLKTSILYHQRSVRVCRKPNSLILTKRHAGWLVSCTGE